MYRLTHILIALALPIVGMAQTNCIDDSGAEFVFNDTINNFNYCSPTLLSAELTACYLEQIKVTFSGVENPNMLVIDIRRPGANCPMRFASSELLSLPVVLGCTDSTAFNYSPSANTDNQSCVSVLVGCTDALAFNFNPLANQNNSSCTAVVLGCIDATAFNYQAAANTSDGSCITLVEGCTDALAFNYNPAATTEMSPSNCDCFGNCALDQDCAGVCGGNAALDECGVCGGAGIADGACNCDGDVLDECGVCGGSGIPEGDCDCDGNVLDECGVCGGDGIKRALVIVLEMFSTNVEFVEVMALLKANAIVPEMF